MNMKLRFYLRGLGIGILVTAIILTIAYRGKTTPMTDDEVRERAKQLGMEDKYGSGTLADMQADGDETEPAAVAETGKAEDAAAANTDKTENTAAADTGKTDDAAATDTDKTDDTAAASDTDKTNNTAAADTGKPDETAATADTDKTDDIAVTDTDKTDDTAAADTDKTDDTAVADTEKTDDTAAADTDKTDETTATDTGKTEQTAETDSENGSDDQADDESPVVSSTDTLFVVSSGQGSDTVAVNLKKAGLVKDSAAFDAYLCSKGYDKILRTGKHVIPAGATEEQIAKILTGAGD